MSHPILDNQTPFAFEALFVSDEEGRPLVAPIVKATFDAGADGLVTLAAEQRQISFAGESYGAPGKSSLRYEPETAFNKPGTDVVLLGHAHAPSVGAVWVDVHFQVGALSKYVRVFGDRFVSGLTGRGISDPAPFERIPLVYERAFGGWDRTPEDPAFHQCDPYNPVGVGFRAKNSRIQVGAPLPNLEDPHDPLTSAAGRCAPAGFGFVGGDWLPRASLAGTYDDEWLETRAPLLPRDFDRRFFNAGSPGLVSPVHLEGTEAVRVQHATSEGYWAFWLPAVAAPRCQVATRFGSDEVLQTRLDTVIVDADAMQVVLIWRAMTALRSGPLDVRAMRIFSDNIPDAVLAPAN